MKTILIGNAISFIAAILMVFIGLIRKKEDILKVQCLQFLFYAISNIILGGYTGAIANFLSIIRNLRCIKKDISHYEKIFYVVVQIILSALLNTSGLLGWLPVIATCIYTLILTTKDEIVIKSVSIFGNILWFIFDFNIKNFVSAAVDIAAAVSTLVGIYTVIKYRKNKNDA